MLLTVFTNPITLPANLGESSTTLEKLLDTTDDVVTAIIVVESTATQRSSEYAVIIKKIAGIRKQGTRIDRRNVLAFV